MNDLATRDYDVNNIGEEDIRFTDCKKEAMFTQISCLCITAIGVILAYVLSPSLAELKGGAQIKTLFGYPLWAMVPALVFLTQSAYMIYAGIKKFKRPSLEARSDIREEEKV